ncbi:MAG: ABC transporter substrate-binding protein [Candidatus Thorarchaeota archaeon]|nr:ABC transporter substrate-binding protein [Candidatus Thorarchaeota archaeon]
MASRQIHNAMQQNIEEKQMSEFVTSRSSRNAIVAVIVIVVIGISAFAYFSFTLPPGNGTTTTTTTTTTDTGITLAVLSRHDLSIQQVYESAFLATDYAIENNITDMIWRTPDAQFWDDIIDDGKADIAWGGGPTLFDQLMRDDRLEPWTNSDLLAAADKVNDTIAGADMKRYNSEEQLIWVADAISTFGFTVNHVFLNDHLLPVPKTWTDLANATYGSILPDATIAMGSAPLTTSNTRIYEIIVQVLGWEEGWTTMTRMAGNSDIYPGSVETQTASERGDVGISMSIDFYGYLTQFRNPDCEYIVPEGQTIVNGDPIAIPKNSPHKDLAEGFVAWALSDEGQAIWLDNDLRRMPVRREAFDLVDPETTEDLYIAFNNTIKTVGIDFNDTLSLEMNAAFVKYWGAIITDAHEELVQCWMAILNEYETNPAFGEAELDYYASLMSAPLTISDPKTSISRQFTIEYATEIDHDIIYDSTYASQCAQKWTAAAKIQYLDIQTQVEALS